jgi:hypothetical protein
MCEFTDNGTEYFDRDVVEGALDERVSPLSWESRGPLTDEHGLTRIRENLMYYLGLDLGQKRDHSALAVVERIDSPARVSGDCV